MRNIQDGRRPVRDEDRRQDLTEIHEERRNRELRLQSRKKRKRKRLIIGIASAVGALILLVVLAILFVRIGSIDVVGLKYKDKSEVIGLSGLQMDDSIFGIRDKFLRENIEKDPHFIYVGWKYKFLKNVIIEVEERRELLLFEFLNTYVIVDEDLRVLGHISRSDEAKYPIVRGINVTEFVLGEVISTDETYKKTALKDVMAALKDSEIYETVKVIDISNAGRITFSLDNEMTVNFGQEYDAAKKLKWIKVIRDTVTAEGYSRGTIDVSSVTAPVYKPEREESDDDTADLDFDDQGNIIIKGDGDDETGEG